MRAMLPHVSGAQRCLKQPNDETAGGRQQAKDDGFLFFFLLKKVSEENCCRKWSNYMRRIRGKVWEGVSGEDGWKKNG